jgi:hypothetical protein
MMRCSESSGVAPFAGTVGHFGTTGRQAPRLRPVVATAYLAGVGIRRTPALALAALTSLALFLCSCTLGAEDVPFTITVTNNTPQTVVDHEFFMTKPGTVNGGGAVVFKPGHSYSESEFSNEGVDPDKLTTLSGKTLGCFPFQFSQDDPGLRVKLSQMVPCKHWVPESHLPAGWPDPKA